MYVLSCITIISTSSSSGSGVIVSSLYLTDLAGSESIKLSQSTGDRRKEGSYINKSLLTLGKIVTLLSEKRSTTFHIPYRDSKLTRILQSSLGGNSMVAIICTVTPASSCKEETINTLKFAARAKFVENECVLGLSEEDTGKKPTVTICYLIYISFRSL